MSYVTYEQQTRLACVGAFATRLEDQWPVTLMAAFWVRHVIHLLELLPQVIVLPTCYPITGIEGKLSADAVFVMQCGLILLLALFMRGSTTTPAFSVRTEYESSFGGSAHPCNHAMN